MDWPTGWNLMLLAIAAYIAVMTLVRLMRQRRDQLVAEVQQQVDARRHRKVENRASKAKNRGETLEHK